MPKRKPTGIEILNRFWSKAKPWTDEKGKEHLLWMDSKSHNGYGQFTIEWKVVVRVHRFAWMLRHGPIPDGLHVLHECDIRHCLADGCLFLGTDADNKRDMIAKNRQPAIGDGGRYIKKS